MTRRPLGGLNSASHHLVYLLIGWVVMGFPIDQALADDMHALSGLQVALLTPGGVDFKLGLSPVPGKNQPFRN